MPLVSKSKINIVSLKFFGKKLINTELIESKEGELIIPSSFKFNHSWELSHKCSNCENRVKLSEDFEKNTKTFNIINGIDSSKFENQIIYDIASIFKIIKAIEIEDITYLNRTDFEYNFDFQRKSSISLTEYKCTYCNTIYLGLFRIGTPLFPEKNLTEGKLGTVSIDEIYEVNIHFFDFHK